MEKRLMRIEREMKRVKAVAQENRDQHLLIERYLEVLPTPMDTQRLLAGVEHATDPWHLSVIQGRMQAMIDDITAGNTIQSQSLQLQVNSLSKEVDQIHAASFTAVPNALAGTFIAKSERSLEVNGSSEITWSDGTFSDWDKYSTIQHIKDDFKGKVPPSRNGYRINNTNYRDNGIVSAIISSESLSTYHNARYGEAKEGSYFRPSNGQRVALSVVTDSLRVLLLFPYYGFVDAKNSTMVVSDVRITASSHTFTVAMKARAGGESATFASAPVVNSWGVKLNEMGTIVVMGQPYTYIPVDIDVTGSTLLASTYSPDGTPLVSNVQGLWVSGLNIECDYAGTIISLDPPGTFQEMAGKPHVNADLYSTNQSISLLAANRTSWFGATGTYPVSISAAQVIDLLGQAAVVVGGVLCPPAAIPIAAGAFAVSFTAHMLDDNPFATHQLLGLVMAYSGAVSKAKQIRSAVTAFDNWMTVKNSEIMSKRLEKVAAGVNEEDPDIPVLTPASSNYIAVSALTAPSLDSEVLRLSKDWVLMELDHEVPSAIIVRQGDKEIMTGVISTYVEEATSRIGRAISVGATVTNSRLARWVLPSGTRDMLNSAMGSMDKYRALAVSRDYDAAFFEMAGDFENLTGRSVDVSQIVGGARAAILGIRATSAPSVLGMASGLYGAYCAYGRYRSRHTDTPASDILRELGVAGMLGIDEYDDLGFEILDAEEIISGASSGIQNESDADDIFYDVVEWNG
jgi:hypothetical protein